MTEIEKIVKEMILLDNEIEQKQQELALLRSKLYRCKDEIRQQCKPNEIPDVVEFQTKQLILQKEADINGNKIK